MDPHFVRLQVIIDTLREDLRRAEQNMEDARNDCQHAWPRETMAPFHNACKRCGQIPPPRTY